MSWELTFLAPLGIAGLIWAGRQRKKLLKAETRAAERLLVKPCPRCKGTGQLPFQG